MAIAITTAMDASGLFAFSALALFPLMIFFWYWERLSRTEMGFIWGRPRHYGLALLHPCLVQGLLILVAWLTGAMEPGKTNWRNASINFAVVAVSTILVAIITEEGFFRGWLWASLKRSGQDSRAVLISTSVAFALWHLSAVLLDTGFNPPPAQVPLFIVNAAAIGAIWGTLRLLSGSIIVSSVCHGVWNGGAYVLFGFGTKTGVLGIQATGLYGPEVGILGLVMNIFFAALWWYWCSVRSARSMA
jgi:membrane protease YdiL (CAAX protease family)